MGILKDLIGGVDKTGIKFQTNENATTREQLARLEQQGVNNFARFLPLADKRARQGFEQAGKVLRSGPRAQINALQQGNKRAEGALLAGAGAYQNAILGLPTGMGQHPGNNDSHYLRPGKIDGQFLEPFNVPSPNSWGQPVQASPTPQNANPFAGLSPDEAQAVSQFLAAMREGYL